MYCHVISCRRNLCMDAIKGLRNYLESQEYKAALGIPREAVVNYKPLAQGEYHRNYVFTHPVTDKKLVLRVNLGSQMHLDDQIEYEYKTLKLLSDSGRTPNAFYVNGSRKQLEQGVLVMEFIAGDPLDYTSDLAQAAACLADIHSIFVPTDSHLLAPTNPLAAILDECEEMFSVYRRSVYADFAIREKIEKLLKLAKLCANAYTDTSNYRCCINTELNNTNFLVNPNTGFISLIDWEKPLYGDPAQDLGHFLAPTTTFWKTDVIFDDETMENFLNDYIHAVASRFPIGNLKERVGLFVSVTCLRGLTWCAMAWDEYNRPDRLLKNESTYSKLQQYLSHEYIDRIEGFLASQNTIPMTKHSLTSKP